MNTGQMLLTVGAMILLSLVILRVDNGFLNTNTILYNSKFDILAVSIGTSVIEEARGKAFDDSTVNNSVSSLASLTPVNQLGPEAGEIYPNFNDFDDYNNFTKIDSTMPSAVFKIKCEVEYVTDTNPDVASNVVTWNKKITVFVTSPSMTDTVKLSSVFSYWYFR